MLARLALAASLVLSSPAFADAAPEDDAQPFAPVSEPPAAAPAPRDPATTDAGAPQLLAAPAAPQLLAAPAPQLLAAPAAGVRVEATLVTHLPAGKQPTTCTVSDDGASLLVTNRGDNSLQVFDLAKLALARTVTDVGYSAWGVEDLGGGRALVANWAGSGIAVVDVAAGKRTGEIPAGMKPSYLAVSPDGKRVYAAGNFSNDVTASDIATKRVVKTLPLGRRPMGVAISADGQILYVAVCEAKSIAKVDAKNMVVLESLPAPLAATTNLVLTADGRRLLAAGENGQLVVMDVATGAVDRVATGTDTTSVAVTPDGRTALVADYLNASVSLVDLVTLEKYASVAVGEGTIHVATDGKLAFTCNDKAGSVTVLRLEPSGETAAMATPALRP